MKIHDTAIIGKNVYIGDNVEIGPYTIIVDNRHRSNSIHNVPDHVLSKQRDRFEVVL